MSNPVPIPFDFNLDRYKVDKDTDYHRLRDIFKQLRFESLIRRLPEEAKDKQKSLL